MRQAGWYWVLLSESLSRRAAQWEWDAARHEHGKWFLSGSAIHLPEGVIHTVGPRIPTPDEPWQTVPVNPTQEMLESTGDVSAEAYSGMLGAWTIMLANAPNP